MCTFILVSIFKPEISAPQAHMGASVARDCRDTSREDADYYHISPLNIGMVCMVWHASRQDNMLCMHNGPAAGADVPCTAHLLVSISSIFNMPSSCCLIESV